MGRFRNLATGAVVSVDDSKDERFDAGWEPVVVEEKPKRAAAKKTAAKKSDA